MKWTDIDFNSRPYVRGDGKMCLQVRVSVYFNSRPYVRGALPLMGRLLLASATPARWQAS